MDLGASLRSLVAKISGKTIIGEEELNEIIEKLKNICGIKNILTWENIQNEL